MKKTAPIFGRSRAPIYVQVASVMRQRIENNEWAVGDKISTLEELEQEFGVARVTIRQGIEMLRKEGLLESQQGRGTFVSGKPKQDRFLNLATDFESMVSQLHDNAVRRVQANLDSAPPEIRQGEGKPAEAYVFIRSVQYNKGVPFSVVSVYVDRDIYERSPEDFQHSAAISLISEMEDVTITHAHQTLTIGVAGPEIAELMKIGLGEPTADCRLILLDQNDRAIYVAEINYHKSCFEVRMDLLLNTGPRIGRPLEERRKIA